MVEAQYDDQQQMDPEDEQAYMMQMQMQQQQQQDLYANEYGDEMMMNQMGQQYAEPSDAVNALVRTLISTHIHTHTLIIRFLRGSDDSHD